MASGGQEQQRESHLISLKVMRLSRPSLVTGHGLYFGSPNSASSQSTLEHSIPPTTPSALVTSERPNTTSILTGALSDLSLSQLERVHPPTSGVVHTISSLQVDSNKDSITNPDESKSGGFSSLDMGDFGVSELLTMPASFGNIYMGETFTSYICANNESAHPVRDVILKAELQTSTLRFALSDTLASQRHKLTSVGSLESSNPSPSPSTGGHIQLLESGKTNEMIVSHEIKELGIHILVCSIQYTTLDGQQKSFRKFYKFQVLNPLTVKTKVNHPTSGTPAQPQDGNNSAVVSQGVSKGGLVLLEAMVQNVSGVTMWMEKMRFEVADAFTVKDLNIVIEEDDDDGEGDEKGAGSHDKSGPVSIFGKHDYFAPNDVRQYLYVLTPKPGKELMAKTTNVLGKMDIVWRSQFGETGRLQTSQLTRKPMPLEEISVQVVKVPEKIRLEEIFTIEIVVKNQSQGGPTQNQQQQQQQQQQQTNPLSRQPSLSHFSGQNTQGNPMLGGTLARPPAAVSRGSVVTPSRSLENTSPHNQQQQQPQHQQQQQPSDQNAMKLILTGVKQKMGAILLSGPNSRQLGSVPAGGEVRVRLDWFPLTSGVQKIGGIRIVDIISGYTVELDHLINCFVEHT
ncbi:hypothetical protein BGZ80_008337 [Entomortierella chlamydospora]|uniref:Trafficking protein particle complex subunit 13 n=1 Tax=Entomortierella chlamydospora TaxID=101097 RepID=A0A9P6MYG2_9FUNG|nr:hypothetical protein BGZ79_005863 [Entomortierella chlamydospora]KAG0017373.1 hypothetical protein BGZ80_008337 [Entomortierella chlamydospora]